MAFSNITGTSEVHFRISLGGPTIYQGSNDPTVTPPISLDGLPLKPGDVYVRTGGVSPGLYTLGIGGPTDWDKSLVAGGPVTVGGNLTVGGLIDQAGPLIILNSGGAGIPVTGAGMEIDRTSGLGENVRWVWDDVFQRWAATNDGANPAINNVYVENHFRVDGSFRAPTGSSVVPSIYFGADANTGIFLPTAGEIGFTSASVERWRIDSSGHFIPFVTNTYNVGATSKLAANVYSTNHVGSFGGVGSPSFTFNTETNSGMYRPAVGTVAITGSGTEIARFDGAAGEVTINNVGGVDSFVINGTGDVFLRVNTSSGGNSAGIELRGPGGSSDNWRMSLDSASSSRLDLEYGGSDLINIQTNGQIQVLDGTSATPTYSFDSDSTAGIFSDGSGSVSVATNSLERLSVNSNGSLEATTASYESLVVTDNIIPNKKYIDDLIFGVGSSSWREPVLVKDDSVYANLVAAEAAMNTGTVDGIAVFDTSRILYTAIAGEFANVFIINGTPGAGATLVEDLNPVSDGDAIYVFEGSAAGRVFAFDLNGVWTEINDNNTGTLYFNYEVQIAGAAQVIFPLANAYAPTPTGSRLLVYVNGIKQQGNGVGYTEVNPFTVTFTVAPGLGKTVEFYSVGSATQKGVLDRETQTGLVGTPVINFGAITYVVGQDGLLVYHNGSKMVNGVDYTETSSTSITWIQPVLAAPDLLEFYSSVPIVAGTNLENIDNVSNTAANDNEVLTWNNSAQEWEPQPIPVGSNIDDLVDGLGGNGATVFNTINVTTTAPSGTKAFIQVFVNGILQKEGPGFSYTVTGANQITFNAAVPATADVTIYEL